MGNNVVVLEKPLSKVVVGGPSFSTAAWSDIQGKPDTFPPSTHDHSPAVAAGADGFMTGADKTKLDGIAPGANNYTHPANHSPSVITQDANNRFVTDAEKASWSGKQPAGTYATGTGAANGTNTGDETAAGIRAKLGITTLSGSNTGDETNASIIGRVLTGLSVATNAVVVAGDTILAAFGKLQAQITGHSAAADPHSQYAKDSDLGTLAGQNADAVNIDGGSVNGTTVGLETQAAGAFTTLMATDGISSSNQNGTQLIANRGSQNMVIGADHLTPAYVGSTSNHDVTIIRGGVPVAVAHAAGLSVTGALTTSGNAGVGIAQNPDVRTPSLRVGQGIVRSEYYGAGNIQTKLMHNSYEAASTEYKYLNDEPASMSHQSGGAHSWHSAPSGTAGQPITFTQHMALTQDGNLLVGVMSGNCHVIAKGSQQGDLVLNVSGTAHGSTEFYSGAAPTYNASATCQKVSASNITGRSINAGGTINASGADYAEYERNNGLSFAKGDIVGFAADGTLTARYADAIRFAVKSTNPSYVGGDTWGSEDQVGKRPEQPVYAPPAYDGMPKPEEPKKPVAAEGEAVNTEADDAEYLEALNGYEDQLRLWEVAQDSHQIKVMVAESFHAAAVAQYEDDIQIFDAKLEAARQSVDRIAYSGKVPCNVLGAHPGGYIIAVEAEDGGIKGEFVADPDFSQYKKAVGRVNRILDDGRCEVAVMVH